MTTGDLPESVTRGFVSYRRDDNSAFGGVVDRFRSDLTSTYEAMTGKQLSLFLDRESIGWGADWRQEIHDSVVTATVFIPIVTMRYFNSQMCMEELLTFHAAAQRLGVTELILPVVLLGAENITEDDSRSEVQLIARLNHKNLEKAWTAGYESAEWRGLITECVRELDKAIQRAEGLLAEEEQVAAVRSSRSTPRSPAESIEESDDGNLSIDIDAMSERMELVAPLTESAVQELGTIGELMGAFDVEGVSKQMARARLLNLANAITTPAQKIEATGDELEKLMFGLDSEVRAFVSELSSIDLPQAREQLVDLLNSMEGAGGLESVESDIQQAIEMVRLISLTNVSLKKALQPAARGFRSVKNAIGVFRGWQILADELAGDR